MLDGRHVILVEALNALHVWLEVEGCGDQVEIINDAFLKAGINEHRCSNCDGLGEWDEGPLSATSSHQISPDYRHVVCADCNGTGKIKLALAPVEAGLSDAEQKAQGARCGCRGSDDYCVCQNALDATTRAERHSSAGSSHEEKSHG